MSDYLWYILEANGVIVFLFAVFKLIKRYLSFGWQRFSLVSIPLFAVLTVWIKHLPASETWSYRIPLVELETITVGRSSAITTGSEWSFIEIVYWLGVFLLSLWTLFSLYKIFSVFLENKRNKEEGFTVIELPDQEAFSFFRFIQLPAGIPDHDRRIIFQHEKIHAEKLHSADRLYFEALHCLSWFNPVVPFMKKELIYVHEFEVDKIMYHKHKAGYMEFLLAYSLGTSSTFYLFTNQFMTKLTLIKRIKIMKNTSKKVLIAALALPIIAGALTLVSFSKEKKVVSEDHRGNNRTQINLHIPEQKTADERETKRNESASKISEMESGKELQFVEPVETTSEISTSNLKSMPQETEVDKMPEFVGGMDALTKYLVSNVRYPETAAKEKVTGKVLVSFVVSKTGEVTNVAVKKGVNKELDEEAKRVISSMPNWIPGEKANKKVDTEMILPIAFQL